MSRQYEELKAENLKKLINTNRLADCFLDLIKINSISLNEYNLCQAIKQIMKDLGAEVIVDKAGQKIRGNSGNLIVRFKGTISAPALMISAHMDTVQPGENINPKFSDGLFKSDGTTILGGDDKSGIAIIIECMRIIIDNQIPHGPIELLFTVGEEFGLLGAKNFQYEYITAPYGYVLDSKDTDTIITHTPSAIKFVATIIGKDAHAGMEPEKGVNSILIAAKAISDLPVGRIDHETTMNVGLIQGGVATNIVPKKVSVQGEARSHDEKKLLDLKLKIISSFMNAVKSCKTIRDDETGEILPDLEMQMEDDFQATKISDDHPVVKIAIQAGKRLGRTITSSHSGVASDANIFFQKGINTVVLGTGMTAIHTVNESIHIDEMKKTVELLLMIIQEHIVFQKNQAL